MAVTHLDQLLAQTRSQTEWLDYFGTLPFKDFMELYDQASDRFPGSLKNSQTFDRHLPIMIAFTRKLLLAGHFMRRATEEERLGWIRKAEDSFGWMRELTSEGTRTTLTELWESTRRYCDKFGYTRGPGFDARAPEKLFRDR